MGEKVEDDLWQDNSEKSVEKKAAVWFSVDWKLQDIGGVEESFSKKAIWFDDIGHTIFEMDFWASGWKKKMVKDQQSK